jgi:transposase-like protein
VLEELLEAAWHRSEHYANDRVEAGHGRLKARLRPMRGLKQDHNASVIVAGHAFVQNVRGVIVNWRLTSRLAIAVEELAWRSDAGSRLGTGRPPADPT